MTFEYMFTHALIISQGYDPRVGELFPRRLKYNSIHDAKEAIGDIQSIREAFIGFQKYLYEDKVVGGEMEEEYLMVAEPKQGYGKTM